jgi:hypothetical protein
VRVGGCQSKFEKDLEDLEAREESLEVSIESQRMISRTLRSEQNLKGPAAIVFMREDSRRP